MMPVMTILVVAAVLAAAASALPCTRRVLLGWYVREVQRVEVSENPGEAIVTYPLA
jgi:hypothetical protein